jgi:ribosome biogenesis GTPase
VEKGVVVSTSRRNARILPLVGAEEALAVRIPTKMRSFIVGDYVDYEFVDGETRIVALEERKNCLARSYRGVTKEIAANLDMLFVIAAPGPIGVVAFIDRVITTCELHHIPHTVVLNKIDLEHQELKEALEWYKKLNIRVIQTSTKTPSGMRSFVQELSDPTLHVVALAGVSGVGKSSILNTLVPEAARRTRGISGSGLGKQTTSQAAGYLYERQGLSAVLVIDLPGIQSFGVSHLSADELGDGFPEIRENRIYCEYHDCYHRAEPHCGVKEALKRGEMAQSRYDSYLAMLQEIEENKSY